MNGKHANVTLTFATDVEPGVVQAAVISKLDELNKSLVTANSYSYDLNARDDEPAPRVFLVLDSRDRIITAPEPLDEDTAHALAESISGVVVELPVAADYRKQES